MPALRFSTNIPEVIALKFAKGREVESQYNGPELMYTLADGRTMYVPHEVGDLLRSEHVEAGTQFEICKTSKGYTVKNLMNAGRQRDAGTAPTAPAVSVRNNEPTYPQNNPSAPRPPAAVAQSGQNGQDRTYTERSREFMACFAEAIDIALEVEKYAERRSCSVEFKTEDLRAIAATLFIETQKRGRC